MTVRHKRPLPALLPFAIGMGFNSYLAGLPDYWLFVFAGLGMLLLLLSWYEKTTRRWQETAVTFSAVIRQRLQLMMGLWTAVLLVLALLLADVRSLAAARAFVRWEPVQQVEGWLLRSFAGVNSRWLTAFQESAEGVGVMPRSYLLGDAPELYETVMMRAQLEVTGPIRPNIHWRSLSYDIYTGRGWARSAENEVELEAGEPIFEESIAETAVVTQTVEWVFDNRLVHYMFGQPQRVTHPVTLYTRRGGEPVFVGSGRTNYVVETAVSTT